MDFAQQPLAESAAPAWWKWLRLAGLLVIAGFYLAIPNARPDFTQFNCHDSESYLALSWNLAHGRGYTRSMVADRYVGHTTWPPGVPILMLPACALSGARIDWWWVKFTMILVGIAGVIAAWFLGYRLAGRKLGGDVAAILVAANPFYWDFSHQAMAETPLTVMLLAGILAIDRAWSVSPPTIRKALWIGVFCGLGMYFKGHAGALLFAPLAYLLQEGRIARDRRWLLTYACFACGFLLPSILWGLRNANVSADGLDGINQIRMIRAVNPVDPESPLLSLPESVQVLRTNLTDYMIYFLPAQIIPGVWHEPVYAWRGSGFIFLTVTGLLLAMAMPWRRWNGAHIVAPLIAVLNLQYAFGGNARFWVPVATLMLVVIAARLSEWLARLRFPTQALVLAGMVLAWSGSLGAYVARHERFPYNEELSWGEKAALFEDLARAPVDSVGVYDGNFAALALMTGLPAHERDDFPTEHLVAHDAFPPTRQGMPLQEIRRRGPWALYRLPSVVMGGEIKHFFGPILEQEELAPHSLGEN